MNKEKNPIPEQAPEKVITPSLEKWTGKVHYMDCIKLMNDLPKNSIKVIVTSPPYNIKNSTGNGLKNGSGGKWPQAGLLNGYKDHSDDMPYPEYVEWQRNCLDAMMCVLRNDGTIFYNHKWRVQNGLLQDRHEILKGFPVRQIIIWKRKGGINFNPGYFLPTYEVIYLIAKPDFKLTSKANAQGDVWDISQARDNEHPAPYPLELAQRCIAATTEGVVLDPFMGSGTTALAAEILNREWIGAEISINYCKMAEDRIKQYHAKKDEVINIPAKGGMKPQKVFGNRAEELISELQSQLCLLDIQALYFSTNPKGTYGGLTRKVEDSLDILDELTNIIDSQ